MCSETPLHLFAVNPSPFQEGRAIGTTLSAAGRPIGPVEFC
jgi:hypothetical protein